LKNSEQTSLQRFEAHLKRNLHEVELNSDAVVGYTREKLEDIAQDVTLMTTLTADTGALGEDVACTFADLATLHPIAAIEEAGAVIGDVQRIETTADKLLGRQTTQEENRKGLDPLSVFSRWGGYWMAGPSASSLRQYVEYRRAGWGYLHLFSVDSPTHQWASTLGPFPSIDQLLQGPIDIADLKIERVFVECKQTSLVIHETVPDTLNLTAELQPIVVLHLLTKLSSYRRRWFLKHFTRPPDENGLLDLFEVGLEDNTLPTYGTTSYGVLPALSWKEILSESINELQPNGASWMDTIDPGKIRFIGGPSLSVLPNEDKNGYCYMRMLHPDAPMYNKIVELGPHPMFGSVLRWLCDHGQRKWFTPNLSIYYEPLTQQIHIERGGETDVRDLLDSFVTWQSATPISLRFLFRVEGSHRALGLNDVKRVLRSQEGWLECRVGGVQPSDEAGGVLNNGSHCFPRFLGSVGRPFLLLLKLDTPRHNAGGLRDA
jgi:hypothetical protein